MSVNCNYINGIVRIAKKYHENGGHDWDHVERVHDLAMHIGKVEGADLLVIELASYLHDIGRKQELASKKGEFCHTKLGASLAEELIADYEIDEIQKRNIIDSILTHRFRNDEVPKTLEAKILFDADKIDSLGAIGIGRLFHFAGQFGGKVHNTKGVVLEDTEELTEEDTAYREFVFKMKKVPERLLTKEGKRIAAERYLYMSKFFDRLLKEVDGEI